MSTFAARRARLFAHMQALGGGVAVLPTASEILRNGDSHYPFRFDSDFYYLSGFGEPDAVLVLSIGQTGPGRATLFCRPKDVEREIWDGFRYGPQQACATFGFDAAHNLDQLDAEMPRLLANAQNLFYNFRDPYRFLPRLQGWLEHVRNNGRNGEWLAQQAHDAESLIGELRLFKDAHEISLMQKAGDISAAAHVRAMRACRPGLHEYALEAELLYEFRKNGAQAPAYTPIVAAGANACILHYSANNAHINDGDIVLIDAGCEFDGYAADITRAFPANGKFTAPQRDVYQLVLDAQLAAFEHAKVDAHYMDGHDAVVKVMSQGMLDLGLLDANKVGGLQDVIEKKAYRKYFMHGTGHWLGLDVHDAGHYRHPHFQFDGPTRPWRTLQAGMVITIEPGIYVRPEEGVPEAFWNIGIRIEDDVLITAQGPHNLSAAAPKQIDEIEAVMRG
ncbi:aminopeptidase P N-terminal domain-containing protein [Massilia sp. W12]|uniref:aminopeptidase P N-terminal domain-containing protein n=1 Tax=Massilia sp. W12 TaxID=3126507 RepID=UPI0030D1EB13